MSLANHLPSNSRFESDAPGPALRASARAPQPGLDKAKEQIAYLKFWLGVMVVTDISLVGWLISSAGSAPAHQVVAALVAVVVITVTGFAVHRRVERLIDALEEL